MAEIRFTLPQIASLFGKHENTIRYHMKRKNICPAKVEKNGRLGYVFDLGDFLRLKDIFEKED